MHIAVQHLLRSVVDYAGSPYIGQKDTPDLRVAICANVKAFLMWLAANGHLRDYRILRSEDVSTAQVTQAENLPPGESQLTISCKGTLLENWEPFEYTYECDICHAFDESHKASHFVNCPLCHGTGKRQATVLELEAELNKLESRMMHLTDIVSTMKLDIEKPVIYASQRPDHALSYAIQKLDVQRKAIEEEIMQRRSGTHPLIGALDFEMLYKFFEEDKNQFPKLEQPIRGLRADRLIIDDPFDLSRR